MKTRLKKISIQFFSAVIAMALLLSPTMIYAQAADNSLPTSYEGELIVVPDENTPPQVSYGGYADAIPLNPFARAAATPTYYWQSLVGMLTGSCYSESWQKNSDKTIKFPIDMIYAKVRVYERGSLAGSDSDTQYNSYTARASYSGEALSFVVSREAYGNHEWQHTGYQTVIKESYAG